MWKNLINGIHFWIVFPKASKSSWVHECKSDWRYGICAIPHFVTHFQISISSNRKSSRFKREINAFSLMDVKLSDLNTVLRFPCSFLKVMKDFFWWEIASSSSRTWRTFTAETKTVATMCFQFIGSCTLHSQETNWETVELERTFTVKTKTAATKSFHFQTVTQRFSKKTQTLTCCHVFGVWRWKYL